MYIVWFEKKKKLDEHVINRNQVVPVEVLADVPTAITAGSSHMEKNVTCNLDAPKTTANKIL